MANNNLPSDFNVTVEITSDDLGEGLDQPIGELTSKLEGLDRVPDIFKSLRECSWVVSEFNSWKNPWTGY